MNTASDFQLDHALIRRRFSACADQVQTNDFLAREISSRMAERLDYIRLEPKRMLDLGCGHGADLAMLATRYPQAAQIGLDFALPQLALASPARSFMQRLLGQKPGPHFICADAHQLPLARASVQLVWSNLLLNWLSDPLPAIRECHRVLEVGGLFMFATLGPDTLKELRLAFDDESGRHVHRFIDMHDIGDCLVQAGFADPVMDMQTLTLTYPDVKTLFHDLRAAAASTASTHRLRSLFGKTRWQSTLQRLEATRQAGRLPVTFELVFGHAWKAAPKTTEDGRAIIQFKPR